MRTLALALLILAVGTPAAWAQTIAVTPPTVAGQWPATDQRVTDEVMTAIGFWREHGVTGCPDGVSAFYAPGPSLRGLDVPGESVLARGGDCMIWLSTYAVRHDWRGARRSWQWKRFGMAAECNIVTHEVGHALGLGHMPSGIMAATDGPPPPSDCRMLARAFYPPRWLR